MDSRKPFAKIWFFSLLILFLVSVSYTSAQIPAPTPPATDATTVSDDKPQEPEVEEVYRQKVSLDSPNDVLIYFREAFRKHEYEKASHCFQLSREQRKMAPKELSVLAWKLGASLDRIDQPGMWTAGKDQDADPHLIKTGDAGQLIIIDQNDKGNWGFTSKTITIIDDVYERVKDHEVVQGRDWLRDQFPKSLQNRGFLIPYYQWLCLFGVILIGAVVDLIVRHILNRLTLAWFKFRKVEISPKLERGVWKPIGLLIRAIVWYYGTVLIGIQPEILRVLLFGVHFFAVVAAVWTAFRFIDLLAVYLQGKAALTETKFDDLLIPLVSRTLKVFAVCIGVLIFAETFDLPVMGLLGGMGVGGIAIAFAAKDTIGNIFGSITVLVDRPFEIGDWIVTDKTEGTVESVGIRSTRVRTFYNSLITIPNSLLTTAVVDNMGRRSYRRYKTVVGVEYSTDPEQIEAFCEGIRELIRRHPYTRKDYYHVYLNEFSSSSLDILVYMFFDCPDWAMELRERHRLILDIIRLAKKLRIQFAFPTQTLHVNQFTHTDPDVDLGDDPYLAGRQQAAHVTGPVLSPKDRPGRVEYLGPIELHEAESHDNDNGDDGDSA